jgi:DNA processing protein
MSAPLPSEAHLCALAHLPGVSPRRLAALLATTSPAEAWERVRRGAAVLAGPARDGPQGRDGAPALELAQRWAAAARSIDPLQRWEAHTAVGVVVAGPDHPSWPERLVDDPEPPAVLFLSGPVPTSPTVAVVGTRRCSGYGRAVADEVGGALAGLGVQVVSGVATGIDAAAQRAALASGGEVVGVVGSGLDVVYPSRNRALWSDLGERGVLLSEWPLGTPPAPWRFPARNRIIAALADVVVVVESGERGGSLYTVEEALRRDRVVMAVPGPIRSAASAGTNRLLRDGAAPFCSVDDVLTALGLCGRLLPVVDRPTASTDQQAVLDAMGWEPCTVDELADRCPLTLPAITAELAALEVAGSVRSTAGWWERLR